MHCLKYPLAVSDADEDEVGVGGNELEAELSEGILEVIEALGVVRARAVQVHLVVQGGECAGLGDGIDVEGLPDFFERANQVRMPDAVAQSQPGEAENLGEGPHQKQVWLRLGPNERQ